MAFACVFADGSLAPDTKAPTSVLYMQCWCVGEAFVEAIAVANCGGLWPLAIYRWAAWMESVSATVRRDAPTKTLRGAAHRFR